MRLVIPYCTEIESRSLKQRIYEHVVQYFDSYGLDIAWKTALEIQGLKAFRMVFDPFEAKGDPVFNFHQLILPEGLQYRVDWIKNDVERILTSIHLIDSTKFYKSEIQDSLLQRIGFMHKGIMLNRLENTPLQKVLDEYYHEILSYNYTVRKLSIEQIDAYCASIEVETYNEWVEVGTPGSGRVNPIFKEGLVFLLNVNERGENVVYTLDWKSTEANLKLLFEYLIEKNHIAPFTTFEQIKVVFGQRPLSDVENPIFWIDKGRKNAKEFNTGLLVELIHYLSRKELIHEKYEIPRNRNQVIEACFRLGDGQNISVRNKRISPYQAIPKKVQELIDFLDGFKIN